MLPLAPFAAAGGRLPFFPRLLHLFARPACLVPPAERVVVRESADLKGLGRLEKHRQQVLRDVHFALVHEVQEGLHLAVVDVLEEYDGVRVRVLYEDRLEVRRARRQDGLVGLEGGVVIFRDVADGG